MQLLKWKNKEKSHNSVTSWVLCYDTSIFPAEENQFIIVCKQGKP